MWSVNGPLSCPGWVHRRGEVGLSPASENRGVSGGTELCRDTARKGREAAGGSRKGKEEASEVPEREKVLFFLFDTLYVLATELVSILNCQKETRVKLVYTTKRIHWLERMEAEFAFMSIWTEKPKQCQQAVSYSPSPRSLFQRVGHQILTLCSSGLFISLYF